MSKIKLFPFDIPWFFSQTVTISTNINFVWPLQKTATKYVLHNTQLFGITQSPHYGVILESFDHDFLSFSGFFSSFSSPKSEVIINYNKLHADPKQGKSLDIVLKKAKHRMVENMSSSTADALGLSRAILCNGKEEQNSFYRFFSLSSGRYWVYSASTRRCIWVTPTTFLIPNANINLLKRCGTRC